MKKYLLFVLSIVLLSGTLAACDNAAKTSSDAPNATQDQAKTPNQQTVKTSQENAQSDVRKNQLDSDIRAREQRNNTTGGTTNRLIAI
jgi:hypothetical protein